MTGMCSISNALEQNWDRLNWLFYSLAEFETLKMRTNENMVLVRELVHCSRPSSFSVLFQFFFPRGYSLVNCSRCVTADLWRDLARNLDAARYLNDIIEDTVFSMSRCEFFDIRKAHKSLCSSVSLGWASNERESEGHTGPRGELIASGGGSYLD